jgi:hypothetical protein
MMIIDTQWIVSIYDHLHPEPSWCRNFRTTTMSDIWVMDEAARAHSWAFDWQFMECRYQSSCGTFIARLLRLSWSSSFSSISMTYHKQFSKSQSCAPGGSGELCSWTQGWIQHDGHHTDRFISLTDRFFYNAYDIMYLNFISQFRHQFSLCFTTSQQLYSRYGVSWSSCTSMWTLELVQCTYHPCKCTDEFSCLTVWSLKGTNSWHEAKLVHKLLFYSIWRPTS